MHGGKLFSHNFNLVKLKLVLYYCSLVDIINLIYRKKRLGNFFSALCLIICKLLKRFIVYLQEFGHCVRLAAHANFSTFVRSAGVDFYPLGGDPRVLAGCKRSLMWKILSYKCFVAYFYCFVHHFFF